MVIHEMTEHECRAMLARTHVVRLACARNNQPYVVPVHVDLDGDFLYSYATLGQKIEWMRANPAVCLEAEELSTDQHWASVIVFGRYEELASVPEHQESRAVAERLFQRHAMWWEPASVPVASHGRQPPIVFRIRIDRITGRRAGPDRSTVHLSGKTEGTQPRWVARVLRRVRRKS
jgi:nitroimidazol reductase NimA-like FMN-containing flavoprotein (pyridoxamine 5'-phosphate oxidase superfamily)